MMVSLDGFIEGPDPELDWAIAAGRAPACASAAARWGSALPSGRRGSGALAGVWRPAAPGPSVPGFEGESARLWNEEPKLVFSRTLGEVGWNSRLIRDGIAEEVTKLKNQPGNDLALAGADLAATFLQLGLIDEFRPIVHPVILGGGKPYLAPLGQPLNLKLAETRTFGSGVIYLRYLKTASDR